MKLNPLVIVFFLSLFIFSSQGEDLYAIGNPKLTFVDSISPVMVSFTPKTESLAQAIKKVTSINNIHSMFVTYPFLYQRNAIFYNEFTFTVGLSQIPQPQIIRCFVEFKIGQSLIFKQCRGKKLNKMGLYNYAKLPSGFPTSFTLTTNDLPLGPLDWKNRLPPGFRLPKKPDSTQQFTY